jgi:hypothetical protein
MKKFKKIALVTSVVLVFALGAFGCKKTTECDGCGEKAKCSEYEVLGEKVWFCEDCEDDINDLKDALK